MKSRQMIYLWVGVGLSTLTACSWLENLAPVASPSPATDVSPAPSSPSPTSSQLPDKRVVPLRIEGQSVEVELKLFDEAAVPFTTYVPRQDFQSESGASSEGQGVWFYFSPDGTRAEDAYIHVFLPAPGSIPSPEELILGDRGLMASNGWELVDRTTVVSYPWAKEKLIYQQKTAAGTAVGAVYMGEYQGKSFYVATHYPAEYTEGFEPRAAVILENMQFRE